MRSWPGLVEHFGRIDLLVNNAGYRIRSPLEDCPSKEWDAMVRNQPDRRLPPSARPWAA